MDAFEQAFFPRYNTRLVRGDDEPVYLPANDVCAFHKIVFAHGFFASALHELAHWCIAGKARRLQEDYGYWYCPDGRDEQAQRMFEKVEVKPQALEKAFSIACQRAFQVSTDNLHGAEPDRAAFTQAVDRQYYHYCEKGFPARAAQLINVLAQTFGGEDAAAQAQKQVA
nr:elongation factor P hydroxylase [Alteromonas halophila]